MSLLESLKHLLDVHFLVATFGYPGLFAVVFAETGLFLGFFLPGDSLLVTAGIFAAKGDLNIFLLISLLFVAGTLGNMVGYLFGHKVGKRLFSRENSLLFHKKHLKHAHAFYEKHGGVAIILARFVPIVRTFAPIVAGIADMPFATFMLYNLLGGFLWTVGITLLGFFLGKLIPDKYFEPIILIVIFVSLLPALYEVLKTKEQRQNIIRGITSLFTKKK
jgi:membrane-associated protein